MWPCTYVNLYNALSYRFVTKLITESAYNSALDNHLVRHSTSLIGTYIVLKINVFYLEFWESWDNLSTKNKGPVPHMFGSSTVYMCMYVCAKKTMLSHACSTCMTKRVYLHVISCTHVSPLMFLFQHHTVVGQK